MSIVFFSFYENALTASIFCLYESEEADLEEEEDDDDLCLLFFFDLCFLLD